jgi:hypothetical protein
VNTRGPVILRPDDRAAVVALGKDLDAVWSAPTTTDRDRKELLRTLLEEVVMTIDRENFNAYLTLRWRGGLLSEVDVPLPRASGNSAHRGR